MKNFKISNRLIMLISMMSALLIVFGSVGYANGSWTEFQAAASQRATAGSAQQP